jgi:hypothetical protein
MDVLARKSLFLGAVKSVLHSTKIKPPSTICILFPLFMSAQLATTLITRRISSLRASIVDVSIQVQGRADFGPLEARLASVRKGGKFTELY